jgi:hypothetical protein
MTVGGGSERVLEPARLVSGLWSFLPRRQCQKLTYQQLPEYTANLSKSMVGHKLVFGARMRVVVGLAKILRRAQGRGSSC